jgi:hypothetical protein
MFSGTHHHFSSAVNKHIWLAASANDKTGMFLPARIAFLRSVSARTFRGSGGQPKFTDLSTGNPFPVVPHFVIVRASGKKESGVFI